MCITGLQKSQILKKITDFLVTNRMWSGVGGGGGGGGRAGQGYTWYPIYELEVGCLNLNNRTGSNLDSVAQICSTA